MAKNKHTWIKHSGIRWTCTRCGITRELHYGDSNYTYISKDGIKYSERPKCK